MAEQGNQHVSSVIAAVKNIVGLSENVYIFRSSVAYLSHQIQEFFEDFQSSSNSLRSSNQVQYTRQLQEFLVHYGTVLSHLTSEKWIQPALNWPTDYVLKYIEGLRSSLIALSKHLSVPSKKLEANVEQNEVNRITDLKALKTALHSLMGQITATDVVGVQQQIKTKIHEIDTLVPPEADPSAQQQSSCKPSAENQPAAQAEKKLSDLLVQFKSINIPLEDIQIENQIGVGGFGKVFRATRLSTSEIVAVKELRSDRLTMSSWASLYAEVETMASVHHKNVLELVGAHITEPYRIITRFCPGKSLFDRLHRNGRGLPPLTGTELTVIAMQVASGMRYLHSMGIVHRDLKTLNILLMSDNTACVADFGLAGMVKDNQELYGGVGTPHYTAPEVLMHMKYGPKVDTFSYGVVLWEMLVKRLPYGDMTHMAIYEHVVTRGWRLTIPNDAPEGLKKLIVRCWSKDPNERPDFDEIEKLFARGEVYFPGTNFETVKTIHSTPVSPPMNLDYALKTLQNASDEHFSGVAYFVAQNADIQVKQRLRDSRVFLAIMNAKVNIDAALLLAGTLLEPNELENFMSHGAKAMFEKCVNSQRWQQVTAAVRFGLKLPNPLLEQVSGFIPQIVAFMKSNGSLQNEYVIQFLARVPGPKLEPFINDISETLLKMCSEVKDQQTFNAIAVLLYQCKKALSVQQLRSFYKMLTCGLVVSPDFVQILMDARDEEYYPYLILDCLKALSKSDINEVFVSFIVFCDQKVFERLLEFQDLLPTIDGLIANRRVTAPLIMLFRIAPIRDFALRLADSPVLQSLLQMHGNEKQRLFILTVLCADEQFCIQTKYMDNILQLVVEFMSNKDVVNEAVRVIAALSTHASGCSILTENGVLDIFSQLFLAPQFGETSRALSIFRNLSFNNTEIPQISLIVSCLMQDLTSSSIDQKPEIVETIISLIKLRPDCVQEHDIQNVVLDQTSRNAPPIMVLLSLRLLNTCHSSVLRNSYQMILNKVREILNTEQIYPEIAVECLILLRTISSNFDIVEFLNKIQLSRYIGELEAIDNEKLLPPIFAELRDFFVNSPKKPTNTNQNIV